LSLRQDRRALLQTNVGELIELASDLRDLSLAKLQSRLQLELEWEAAWASVSIATDGSRQIVQQQPVLCRCSTKLVRQELGRISGAAGELCAVCRSAWSVWHSWPALDF